MSLEAYESGAPLESTQPSKAKVKATHPHLVACDEEKGVPQQASFTQNWQRPQGEVGQDDRVGAGSLKHHLGEVIAAVRAEESRPWANTVELVNSRSCPTVGLSCTSRDKAPLPSLQPDQGALKGIHDSSCLAL